MKSLLDKGVYGFPEAARLARVEAANMRRWFLGRTDQSETRPVLRSDIPAIGEKHAISFLDLIDLRVVGRFREFGISMQTIRRVYQRLGEEVGSQHAFAHSNLCVYGKTVMQRVADEDGNEELREVLSGHRAMPRILKDFLSDIQYSERDGLAERWNIHQGVVIDPLRNLGKPISVSSGAGTHALARAYEANSNDADLVADLFNTSRRAVLDAVAFELSLATGGRTAA